MQSRLTAKVLSTLEGEATGLTEGELSKGFKLAGGCIWGCFVQGFLEKAVLCLVPAGGGGRCPSMLNSFKS